MADTDRYRPISFPAARALADSEKADFALYLPTTSDGDPVLYREKAAGLAVPDFDRLKEAGVDRLLVSEDDIRRCEDVVEAGLGQLVGDPDIPPADKAEALHSVGSALAEGLIHKDIKDNQLQRTASYVENIIQGLLHDSSIVSHLLAMAEFQRSAASHMMIVGSLAVTLAHEVFGPEREILLDIGMAGMLHDLGKLSIGPEVLHKATALTRDEVEMIEQHPIESVRLLQDAPHVSTAARQIIIQHHERVDGNGYPIRLCGPALLTGSRVLSIVDTFHAMIGRGFYHGALTVPEAIRAIERQAGQQFDADLVACWIDLISRLRTEQLDTDRTEPINPSQEESFRHEHRVFPKASTTVASNSLRALCEGRTTVKCIYAGRLRGISTALNEFLAPLNELSRGAMSLHTPHPLYRGEVLHVRVSVGDNKVWVRAIVLWCSQQEDDIYKTQLQLLERISPAQANEQVPPRGIDEMILLNAASPKAEEPATPEASTQPTTPRDAAMAALGAIASMSRIPPAKASTLIALAQSGDSQVRLRAMDVLARVRTRAARETLGHLLADTEPAVRQKALVAVGALRLTEFIDAVRAATGDPDPDVARAAAAALNRLTRLPHVDDQTSTGP
jgi:HD-GYP domain-containing protein (c-di-GMP phosphodiesterase class II)